MFPQLRKQKGNNCFENQVRLDVIRENVMNLQGKIAFWEGVISFPNHLNSDGE